MDVYDSWLSIEEAHHEYGITPVEEPQRDAYASIILAAAHYQFASMRASAIHTLGKTPHMLYDPKYVLPAEAVDLRLHTFHHSRRRLPYASVAI